MSDDTKSPGPVIYVAIERGIAPSIATTALEMSHDPHTVIVLLNRNGGGAVVIHTTEVDEAELREAFASQHAQFQSAMSAGQSHLN